MMIGLFCLALVTGALASNGLSMYSEDTTTTSTCESYETKYDDIVWNSTLLYLNDPCFGYSTSCCESDSGGGSHCSWKETYWCATSSTCTADDGDECPACCESDNLTPEPTAKPTAEPAAATTESPEVESTPSPTMHSAKKWEMLHPDYQGGDGELLWNVYYGDYAQDERFSAFRNDQLWDAQVIRPIIEMDVKYERFQLAHQSLNAPRGESKTVGHQWVIVAAAAMVILAAFAMWCKQRNSYKKIVDPLEENQALLTSYGQ